MAVIAGVGKSLRQETTCKYRHKTIEYVNNKPPVNTDTNNRIC